MERIDGPTPNGGDYSEIVYIDENGNVTDGEHAVAGAVYEYRNDGSLVADTHFRCDRA